MVNNSWKTSEISRFIATSEDDCIQNFVSRKHWKLMKIFNIIPSEVSISYSLRGLYDLSPKNNGNMDFFQYYSFRKSWDSRKARDVSSSKNLFGIPDFRSQPPIRS